jgi:hypothetical protein
MICGFEALNNRHLWNDTGECIVCHNKKMIYKEYHASAICLDCGWEMMIHCYKPEEVEETKKDSLERTENHAKENHYIRYTTSPDFESTYYNCTEEEWKQKVSQQRLQNTSDLV